MKLNIFKSSIFLLVVGTLVSCSEGKYWDEPSNPGSVYAFVKPAETVSVPATDPFPSTYEVTVSRNNPSGDISVPVIVKSSSPSITGPATVNFANGETSAKYTLSFSDGLFAGISYSVTLTLEQPEDVLTQVKPENLVFDFKISKVLVLQWVSAGSAPTYSDWGGNEDPIDIPVEIATNYPSSDVRLCRLIEPYKYLDPTYTPDSANLEFFIDNDGNAAEMGAAWQYMGQNDSEEGYYFFGCPADYGGEFYNEGNVYVMSGIVGTAPTIDGKNVSPGWYETIMFQWDAPSN